MEKKQKLKVEIEVWDIEVEEVHRYSNGHGEGWYRFKYSTKVNGGKKKLGKYESDWSNQTKAHFKGVLKRGHAAKIVLENLI